MTRKFEYDPHKDSVNQRKHGVSFEQAKQAFDDVRMVIKPDAFHSREERRLFCFGKVDGEVMTVRLPCVATWFVFLERLIGGKEGKYMKKRKVRYENAPFGKVVLGKETWIGRLPRPEELAAAERTAKITLAVTASSLKTLKKLAEKSGIPYQVMIRRLLDAYVAQA